jgi:hypothetical protein
MTRNALEGDSDLDLDNSAKPRSSAWVRLSVLRLIGVVPWSGINIACGVCGVALTDCMLGAFIGALPWTAVTCQVKRVLLVSFQMTNSGTITSDRRHPTNRRVHPFTHSPDHLIPFDNPRNHSQAHIPFVPVPSAHPWP